MPVVIDYADMGTLKAAQNAYWANRPQATGGGGVSVAGGGEINAETLPGDVEDLGDGQRAMADGFGHLHPLADTKAPAADAGPKLQADGSLAGNNYYAGPDSGPAQAAQTQAGKPSVKTVLSDGRTVTLTAPQAATYDTQNARTESADERATAQRTQQNAQFRAKLNQGDQQFLVKMDAADADRQQKADATQAKLEQAATLANGRAATAADKERLAMALKVHESVIAQAKAKTSTAQRDLEQALTTLRGIQANFGGAKELSAAQAAVEAAKTARETAGTAFSQAQDDLQRDLDSHITAMGGGTGEKTPDFYMRLAGELGSNQTYTDDAAAKRFVDAAGGGHVATQNDVFAAMQQAKGDKAAAIKALKAKGFQYDRFGNWLEGL